MIHIPVTEATAIAHRYRQDAVLIVTLDQSGFAFVTYGQKAADKVRAARISDEFQKFLGCDMTKGIVHEDFREPGEAAIIKEQRDKLLLACRGMEKEARDILANDDPSSYKGCAAQAVLDALNFCDQPKES